MLERAADVGRFEELLGGNAAPVQARAANLVPLDEGDVESGRRAVEGGCVAAGPAADDDDIELLDLVSHDVSLRLTESPAGQS